MISDERQNIHELGLRRILKARLEKSSTLRQFKIPKLNFDASDYFDLIDWQDTTVTTVTLEPPLTVIVSEADVPLFVATLGDSTVDANKSHALFAFRFFVACLKFTKYCRLFESLASISAKILFQTFVLIGIRYNLNK